MNELDVQESDVASDAGATQSKGNGLAWVAIAVGAFGLIAGVVGIVVANKASQELASLSAQLANQPDPVEAFQSRLKDFDDRLVNVGAEVVRSNNAMRGQSELIDRVQRALAESGNAIRANREQINKNTSSLASLAESGIQARPRTTAQATAPAEPSASASSGAETQAATETTSSGETGIHIIQSGDTFARLADRYGVSLADIMEANPGVNPNRLQIGQQIVIP